MLKKSMIVLVIGMLFVVGCGNSSTREHEGHEEHTGHKIPDMIKVDLQVPEEVKVNDVITISARVTQNDEAIDDAEKVEFELWLDGTDSERIEGKLLQNGTYQISRKFDQVGTYFVISHVTARGMHSMPKKEFRVKHM